jgi:hypothetical protein
MSTATSIKPAATLRPVAWLPLAILPAAVMAIGIDWPAWVWMWALAVAIYGSLKWLTFADCAAAAHAPLGRTLGYLLLWPGMDAESFFATPAARVPRPAFLEFVFAVFKTLLGVALLGVVPTILQWNWLVAGWVGMAGIVFTLHFGAMHVLSVLWRAFGVDAPPIMNAPILAASLSEFWGQRWNLAFRNLSHRYVFAPLHARLGVAGATLLVFAISGLIHDLVITLPARSGYGLPTLYFLIHGAALLVERSRWGKRIGLRRGITGRLFAVVVVLAPAPLLFSPAFIERVVLPTIAALGGS